MRYNHWLYEADRTKADERCDVYGVNDVAGPIKQTASCAQSQEEIVKLQVIYEPYLGPRYHKYPVRFHVELYYLTRECMQMALLQ